MQLFEYHGYAKWIEGGIDRAVLFGGSTLPYGSLLLKFKARQKRDKKTRKNALHNINEMLSIFIESSVFSSLSRSPSLPVATESEEHFIFLCEIARNEKRLRNHSTHVYPFRSVSHTSGDH